jgi:hypothetical protein
MTLAVEEIAAPHGSWALLASSGNLQHLLQEAMWHASTDQLRTVSRVLVLPMVAMGPISAAFGQYAEPFVDFLRPHRSPLEMGCSGRHAPEWRVCAVFSVVLKAGAEGRSHPRVDLKVVAQHMQSGGSMISVSNAHGKYR